MSDATALALEAAIEAHVADENPGDIASAYVLVAETTSLNSMDEQESTYYITTRHGQSRFMTDGLLYNALNED